MTTYPCEITIEQWKHETDTITIKSLNTGKEISKYRHQDTSSIRSIIEKVFAITNQSWCKNTKIDLSREEMIAFKNLK